MNTLRPRLSAWLTAVWAVLVRGLRNGLPTLLIGLTLTMTLARAVADAEWVKDSGAIQSLLFWGMIVGWLLALTHWPGWAAALYSMLFSTVLSGFVIGEILPPLDQVRLGELFTILGDIRLKLVAFGLRAGGWMRTLETGGTVRDTGLFVFLLASAGWTAAVWLMWWLVRRRSALPGVLPITLLMAINTHLNRQMVSIFVVYLVVVFLTLARSAFTHSEWSWQRRRVDYSEDLAPEWGVGASLAALSVAVFALAFSLVGTPEGLRILADFVERSRQEMNDTANQLFGGVKPPPPSPDGNPDDEPLPRIDTPNLGEIGAPLPQGNRTVMWVWISDAPPIPDEIQGPPRELIAVTRHYWRSQIFAEYTGRGWLPAPLFEGQAAAEEIPDVPRGRYLLEQRYEIEARHSGVLFSVSDPAYSSNATVLRRVSPDSSRLVEGRASEYTVKSLATNITIQDLELADTVYPPDIENAYLQLPPGLPERVRLLADEITAGVSSPYQKAQRIQDYLRLNYTYTLDTPPSSPPQDVVDYFLFDAEGGFCSHFSSTMVVLLRAAGVPARVVTGYAMGGYDRNKGMYRVPASASHAWVEVFFPGYGWVEFEPTPAYPVFVYAQGYASEPITSPPDLSNPTVPVGSRTSQALWLLAPLGLVILLWTVFLWGRWEKRRLSMPGKAAFRLYQRVRQGFLRAGLPEYFWLTPNEYASEVVPALELYPRLVEALERSTRVYVQAAYTPRDPSIDDVLMGESAWSEARGELVRLWFNLRILGAVNAR